MARQPRRRRSTTTRDARAPRADARGPRLGGGRRAVARAQATDRRHPPGAAVADRRPPPSAVAAAPRHAAPTPNAPSPPSAKRKRAPRGPRGRGGAAAELDVLEQRRGRERNGRPVGRYLMCVQVRDEHGPGRRARGAQPDRALRQPAGRRHQPDPRQHLRRAGAERAAGHGGGVRRHRHAEERRALPRRRAVRRRGHRGARRRRPDRGHPAGPPADRLPGDEEPDRRQGRSADPGGLAPRPVRRADPELQDLRHLQAPPRRRAQAAAGDPRPGQAGAARADRAHRRGARHRGGAARRHDAAARPVERDRGQGQVGEAADVALPRAGAGRAGDPRGVQRRLPRGRHRRPAGCTRS